MQKKTNREIFKCTVNPIKTAMCCYFMAFKNIFFKKKFFDVCIGYLHNTNSKKPIGKFISGEKAVK